MDKHLHCIVLWYFFGVLMIHAQNNLNDECSVARSGSSGLCRFLEECSTVIIEITQQSLYPTVCGYQNDRQIVCCPNPSTRRTTTTNSPATINRISAKKCAEYQDAVYERVLIAVGFGDAPIMKKVFRCPISTLPLVIGGTKALPKEFPHMALIGFKGNETADNISWSCAGTLISHQFVLTAAHCTYNRIWGFAKYVLLGDLQIDSTEDDARPQQFKIIGRKRHPNYKYVSKYNDIALLKIDRRVEFNQYIRPACLPESNAIPTKQVIASGWGKTDYHQEPSKNLRKVVLELFTHEECYASYADQISRYLSNGVMDETQLCAGSHMHKKDTCHGDSGGPIQVYHSKHSCMYTAVGITSFGKRCGTEDIPGVYTRIFPYLSWIESVVWPQEDQFI